MKSARNTTRVTDVLSLAESEGFEPSKGINPYFVSSEALSTTQPTLQLSTRLREGYNTTKNLVFQYTKHMKSSVYVALLRGINVGGNNIIKMDALRGSLSKAGLQNVTTYIQSGNIIFTSPLSASRVSKKVSTALERDFGYSGKVFIRDLKQIKKVVATLPKTADDPKWKTNVLFLEEGCNPREVTKDKEVLKEECVANTTDAVIWSINMSVYGTSSYSDLPKQPVYKQMTIRNARTTNKILELMEQVAKL